MTDQNKWISDPIAVTSSDPSVRERLAMISKDVFAALEMANKLREAIHGEAPITNRDCEAAHGLEGQIAILGIIASDLRDELARIRV